MSSRCVPVRALTYNVFCRPPFIVNTNHWTDYKWERLQDIVHSVLPLFDIIGIQELFHFGSKRRSWFLDQAYEQGFKTLVCSDGHFNIHIKDLSSRSSSSRVQLPAIIDGGLVILSRYPQAHGTKRHEMVYSESSGPDSLARKGAIMVTLELPNERHLDVYCTHMQAEDGPDKAAIRFSQLNELTRFIEACDTENDAILFSDMNIDSNDADTYARLCSEMQVMGNECANEQLLLAQDVLQTHSIDFPLITYGDNGKDCVLTHMSDANRKERIDYIWMFRRVIGAPVHHFSTLDTSIPTEQFVRNSIRCDSAHVEKFLRAAKSENGPPYEQLSDHYGVSAIFLLDNKK